MGGERGRARQPGGTGGTRARAATPRDPLGWRMLVPCANRARGAGSFVRDGRAILTPVARLPSSGTERLLARTHGAPGTFTPREPRTRIAPTPHGSQRAPFQPGSKAHSLEYRLIKAASLKARPIAKTICTLGGPARSPNVQRAGRQRGIRMGRRSGRRGNGCGLPRCELHPGGGGWTGGLLTVAVLGCCSVL